MYDVYINQFVAFDIYKKKKKTKINYCAQWKLVNVLDSRGTVGDSMTHEF